jgi:predicted acetyltransferase
VGMADKQAVAFCAVSKVNSKLWYLSRAGVLPTARGKGMQKRMIRVRVKHAFAMGGSAVVTDCTADNVASANSLINCGFKLYFPENPWALSNSIYWIKYAKL